MISPAYKRGWEQVINNVPYRNPYDSYGQEQFFTEFEKGRVEALYYKENTKPIIDKIFG